MALGLALSVLGGNRLGHLAAHHVAEGQAHQSGIYATIAIVVMECLRKAPKGSLQLHVGKRLTLLTPAIGRSAMRPSSKLLTLSAKRRLNFELRQFAQIESVPSLRHLSMTTANDRAGQARVPLAGSPPHARRGSDSWMVELLSVMHSAEYL